MSVVMGVLILSFAVWGIADIFKGFGQSTLAKIGSTEISTEQFRQLYTEKLQQLGRQFGRPLTMDQARAFGLDRQVLQQTIAEAALDEEARRMGLGMSDAETMRMIYADPNFKGVSGAFDPQRFQATIRQFGFTEQRYIAEPAAGVAAASDRRHGLGRSRAAESDDRGAQPLSERASARSNTSTRYRAGRDHRCAVAGDAGRLFRRPQDPVPLARISQTVVRHRQPEEIGKWASVSDEDAKKRFEERRGTLGTPEQRQVSQIVFPNADEAAAARSRIASGTSFEDLAKERGLNPADVDLGTIAKSAIIDPAIADAAFSLPSGEVSQAGARPVRRRAGQDRQGRARCRTVL